MAALVSVAGGRIRVSDFVTRHTIEAGGHSIPDPHITLPHLLGLDDYN